LIYYFFLQTAYCFIKTWFIIGAIKDNVVALKQERGLEEIEKELE